MDKAAAVDQSGKALIDRIIYLASLVSEPRSVDDSLDKLRRITARQSNPTPEDIRILQSIETELKDYLLHKERLRSFTEEYLKANVERHFALDNPAHEAKKIALTQTLGAAGGAILVTILAVALGMRGQVVLAFLVCTLFIGLAFLFQSVKKDLVGQLHGAVSYLMTGTIGTGLFALHFPLIAANSYLEQLPLLQHAGFMPLAIPVYGAHYIAFYLYAKQLNAPIPRILRPAGVAISAVVIAAIFVLIPHPTPVAQEIFFDISVGGLAPSVYFSAIAAVLGFMIVPKTTALYSQTNLFLAISMVLQTVGNGFLLMFVIFPSGAFPVNEERGQIIAALFIMSALTMQYISAYKIKKSLR